MYSATYKQSSDSHHHFYFRQTVTTDYSVLNYPGIPIPVCYPGTRTRFLNSGLYGGPRSIGFVGKGDLRSRRARELSKIESQAIQYPPRTC